MLNAVKHLIEAVTSVKSDASLTLFRKEARTVSCRLPGGAPIVIVIVLFRK